MTSPFNPCYIASDEGGSYVEEFPTSSMINRMQLGPLAPVCYSATDAAEMWAEKHFGDYDYPDELRCLVKDPTGRLDVFDVYIQRTVEFRAVLKNNLRN